MKNQTSMSAITTENLAKPLLKGAVFGLVAIIITLMLIALIMSFGILPISSAPALASVSVAVGAFFAGFIAAKKFGKNGILVGALCGAVLFALFTLIGLAAFSTAPSASTLIRLIVFITASAVGGIVGVGGNDKRKIV